jgi:hypothetical protein
MSKPLGVWHCLQRLARENNPRLVAIIERKDAKHLLETREALKALATGNVGKAKITAAKRLLAKQ